MLKRTSLLLIFALFFAISISVSDFNLGPEEPESVELPIIEEQPTADMQQAPVLNKPAVNKIKTIRRLPEFRNAQKKNSRVKNTYNEKESLVFDKLEENNIDPNDINIIISAYKSEKILEVYAKNGTDTEYRKVFTYDICKSSGVLGPKRRKGDEQVPEGFYYIEKFNPNSNYYLSLGVSYPNKSDRKKSTAGNLGGDIYIHGDCVTIGCLPLTDDKIKEVYLLAVQAMSSGQTKIPVYIFPYKMTDENTATFSEQYRDNQSLVKFWKNLKPGFDAFVNTRTELNFSIDDKGDYIIGSF